MRLPIGLILVLAACGDDGGGTGLIDAPANDDARTGDAATDAPLVSDAPGDATLPDAPTVDASMDVTTACTNACTKLNECFQETDPTELQGCIDDCSVDLADCTPAQVTQVDACSQSSCSGPNPDQWAITMCIGNIACVNM